MVHGQPTVITDVPTPLSAHAADQFTANPASAMRLGWSVAQVGGRYRQVALTGPKPARNLPNLALAVSDERSPLELAIQTEAALSLLSKQFGVDFKLAELTGMRGGPQDMTSSDYLRFLTQQVIDSINQPVETLAFSLAKLNSLLWSWNEAIEDLLHAMSLTFHAAYELGLCLGEVWWSRDPERRIDESLADLLGAQRAGIIVQLLNRLSGSISPLTIGAMTGSVMAWSEWLSKPHSVAVEEIEAALSDQTLVWHDLLLEGADPRQYSVRVPLERRSQIMRKVVVTFLPQVCIELLAISMVFAGLFLFGRIHSPVIGALVAATGVVGITAASLYAAAKNMVLGSLRRIRGTFEIEAAQFAVTRLPGSEVLPRRGRR